MFHNASSACRRFISADDNGVSCSEIPTHKQFTKGFDFIEVSPKLTEFDVPGFNGSADVGDFSATVLSINSFQCFHANGSVRACPASGPFFDSVAKSCSDVESEVSKISHVAPMQWCME